MAQKVLCVSVKCIPELVRCDDVTMVIAPSVLLVCKYAQSNFEGWENCGDGKILGRRGVSNVSYNVESNNICEPIVADFVR